MCDSLVAEAEKSRGPARPEGAAPSGPHFLWGITPAWHRGSLMYRGQVIDGQWFHGICAMVKLSFLGKLGYRYLRTPYSTSDLVSGKCSRYGTVQYCDGHHVHTRLVSTSPHRHLRIVVVSIRWNDSSTCRCDCTHRTCTLSVWKQAQAAPS